MKYVVAGILLWSFLCFTEATADSMSDRADIAEGLRKFNQQIVEANAG